MGADFWGKRGQYFSTGASRSSSPPLAELHGGHGGQRFGNGAQTKQCVLAGGHIVFKISETKAGDPLQLTILYHGNGDTRHMGGPHELGDRRYNLRAPFGCKTVVLGADGCARQQ